MIPLAMPLVATTQHSNGAIAVAMQQIDQIFGVGSLASNDVDFFCPQSNILLRTQTPNP